MVVEQARGKVIEETTFTLEKPNHETNFGKPPNAN